MKFRSKIILLVVLTLASVLAVYMPGPISQDPAYHHFCDDRTFFGIADFANVISNVLFVLVGVRGLLLLEKSVVPKSIFIIYLVLFSGILLTGFGSAYYHSSPDNDSLVFDRLPMTIVFMALSSATIGEQIDVRIGVELLFPLLTIGIISVVWWHYTELAGAGDLRLYILVQYYPIVLIPVILLLFPSPGTAGRWLHLGWVVIWYVIAKVFDRYDCAIYSYLGFVSGHTLKHLAATMATWYIVKMYSQKHLAVPANKKRAV